MGILDKIMPAKNEKAKKEKTEMFDYTTGEYGKLNTNQKLKLFSDLFRISYASYQENLEKMEKRDALYFGTKAVTKSTNSKSSKAPMDADIVPNICYELIEAEKEMSIPSAIVTSRIKNRSQQERMLKNILKYAKDELNMENMQDRTEQTTYVQGHSYVEVLWDSAKNFIGMDELHPKSVIPQVGVYELEAMDYFFIPRSRTKNFIKKKYGRDINVRGLKEMYPEFNNMGSGITADDTLITEITVYYKDANDNVGRFVFSDKTAFEDNPNIYSRAFKTCTNPDCKEEDGTDVIVPVSHEGNCPLCDGALTTKVSDTEKLESDVTKPGKDKDTETGKMVIETIPAGTEVKLFNPKVYPVVQRINVPEPFSFGGHSDVDTIEDKQNALKKTATKVDEKINKSGVIVTMKRGTKAKLTNETYQVIEVDDPAQLAMITVKDLKASIGEEIAYIDRLRESAKNTLGITNSWLGQPDATAQSGKAKQVQVQQSAGRFASKMVNKYKFYKDLYRMFLYFVIVFSDEPIYLGAENDLDDGEADLFNKYILLEQDKDNKYFFDDSYVIRSENNPDFTNDKQFLFEVTMQLITGQIIDAKQGMKILKQLGFPLAETIINEAETEATNQLAIDRATGRGSQGNEEAIMEVMKNLPPEHKQKYLQMSPEEQKAFISEALGQGQQQAGQDPMQSV